MEKTLEFEEALENIECDIRQLDETRRAWATIEKVSAAIGYTAVNRLSRSRIAQIGLDMCHAAETLLD